MWRDPGDKSKVSAKARDCAERMFNKTAVIAVRLAEADLTNDSLRRARLAVKQLPGHDRDRISLAKRLEDLTAQHDEQEEPFDVFLAAPMAAAKADYEATRALALRVKRALTESCGANHVYCASEEIADPDDFDLPDVALVDNMLPFKTARRFVLLYPASLPSSVLVEAGLALAYGMPSLYLVPTGVELPFMLRDVSAGGVDHFPTVRLIEYESEDSLISTLTKTGPRVFPPRHTQDCVACGGRGQVREVAVSHG
jgi:hypothetical protein